ncbi:MAG: sugar phosphate sensor protein [Planctomycetes bacterium GWF2_41_51]|nr:MAG: sugar phosphate sensor protein [Planctomycetes bacterium GWF2_41_51]
MFLLDYLKPAKPIEPIKDVGAINKLFRKYRLNIIFAMTLGYGFYYTCRLGLSVVKKPLIDGGILSPEQLGQIGAAMFYGYAFGKFVNGFLADHLNIRKLFVMGLVLSGLCNLFFGFSHLLWIFILVWAINGWVQSLGAGSCVVSLAHWYTFHERGRYYGIWSTSHSIGEGLTFIVSSTLVTYFGWRAGFLGPGVACIALSGLFYWLMQDRPAACGLPRVSDWKNEHGQIVEPKTLNTFSAQMEIFKNPAIWILCFASAMMYITRYAVTSWGMLFLQEAKGYNTVQAGTLLGINTFMGVIGGLVYGYISDKTFNGRRPPASFLYGIFELLSLAIIFIFPVTNFYILASAFALFGFTIGGMLLGFAGLFAVDIAPKKAAGAVVGFIGIFSYIATALQEHISGYLIEKHSQIVDGVMKYDFSSAIIFWIGASLIATLLGLLVWNAKIEE